MLCATVEEELRFKDLIDQWIVEGSVPKFPEFVGETRKDRIRRGVYQEAKEAKEALREIWELTQSVCEGVCNSVPTYMREEGMCMVSITSQPAKKKISFNSSSPLKRGYCMGKGCGMNMALTISIVLFHKKNLSNLHLFSPPLEGG